MGDTVIIRHQRARDFTILDNAQVRDARLSWKARGLIAYLLSLPEGWQLRISFLVGQAPDGRCSTTAGLAELKKFGYLLIERERGARGRFVRTVWTVIQAPSATTAQEQPAPSLPAQSRLPRNLVSAADGSPNSPQSENRIVVASHHDPENRIVEKWIGTTEEPSVRRTTTTDGSGSATELVMPSALAPAEVVVVDDLIAKVPVSQRQAVLDELAGAMAKPGHIRTSRVAFLRSLVERVQQGEFHSSLGIQVAKARRQRAAQAKADAQKRADREQRRQSAHSEASHHAAAAELAKLRKQLGMGLANSSDDRLPSGKASAAEGG